MNIMINLENNKYYTLDLSLEECPQMSDPLLEIYAKAIAGNSWEKPNVSLNLRERVVLLSLYDERLKKISDSLCDKISSLLLTAVGVALIAGCILLVVVAALMGPHPQQLMLVVLLGSTLPISFDLASPMKIYEAFFKRRTLEKERNAHCKDFKRITGELKTLLQQKPVIESYIQQELKAESNVAANPASQAKVKILRTALRELEKAYSLIQKLEALEVNATSTT